MGPAYPSRGSEHDERHDGGPVLKRAGEYLATYALLAILAALILGWTLLALILLAPLPERWRRASARYTMRAGFCLFARMLTASGAYELDLDAIDTLRGGPPVILAPNHPTSIDAMLLLTRHPDLACILKPELMRNVFLGAGARLARFIRSDPPRRMIREAVAELRRGGLVLLFPGGHPHHARPRQPTDRQRRRHRPARAGAGPGGLHRDRLAVPRQGLADLQGAAAADPLPGPPGPALRSRRKMRRIAPWRWRESSPASSRARRRTTGWAEPTTAAPASAHPSEEADAPA